MMKKWLLASALSIGVAGLAGCNSGGDNEEAGTGSSSNADAEMDFPTQEVRIVIPYDPGGASDSHARAISEAIQNNDLLSENVNVVNLPGANTRNGLEEVLNADPDGHTVLLHHSTLNSMNAVNQIDISYEDYALIGQATYTPNVLVGSSDSEYSTYDEYLEAAKEDPGSISVGIPAVGSTAHLAYEAIAKASGGEDAFKVVPFQSGGDLITAHEGGQVDLRIASTPDAISYVESGDVIPLVSTSEGPHFDPLMEDAMTMSDFDFDQDVNVRFGLYAPKETPEEVVEKLEDTLEQVVETDEFQEFAENNGVEAKFLNKEEFTEINEDVQALFEDLSGNIDVDAEEQEAE
ncbi:tripartite tricarboxylate transporter substrate binding protein [Alteribacillus sp. YIM 98480]|uniref:Bug family tripartite tricarboxylate transporter substrate binding protein n=1 Tax=Alteribacillus sp. YIM 98480 TaxID=2606599 RepID=UPI00131C1E6D|nr:tripartite tricarboxylate transporter substrate binding protein [Alteribacillus sp. YIM 98480]